jgi:hypothetical protein
MRVADGPMRDVPDRSARLTLEGNPAGLRPAG